MTRRSFRVRTRRNNVTPHTDASGIENAASEARLNCVVGKIARAWDKRDVQRVTKAVEDA